MFFYRNDHVCCHSSRAYWIQKIIRINSNFYQMWQIGMVTLEGTDATNDIPDSWVSILVDILTSLLYNFLPKVALSAVKKGMRMPKGNNWIGKSTLFLWGKYWVTGNHTWNLSPRRDFYKFWFFAWVLLLLKAMKTLSNKDNQGIEYFTENFRFFNFVNERDALKKIS